VAPTDTAVLDPVPSHPRERPTRRLITLITCDPAWTGTYRVIVTGVLVAASPGPRCTCRSTPPASLAEV
jgi:Sortase (surface protein transpeptidase)